MYGDGGRKSLAAFSGVPIGLRDLSTGQNVPISNPFDPRKNVNTSNQEQVAQLQFANRHGISKYAQNANQLALALSNPAVQLVEVNLALGELTAKLTDTYERYVGALRQQYLPEEEIFARADAYIKPLLAAEMDLLKMQYPYAIGGMAGGQYSPIAGIAQGRGKAGENFEAAKQFQNWRSLKKAFKARKAHRKGKKQRSK